MTRLHAVTMWTAVAATTALLSGCDAASDRSTSDTKPDAPGVTGRAVEAAKDTGRAAGDAVMTGGRAADAAFETADVKAALMADSRVNAGDINVDTDHVSKTVTLKGRVPTVAQKVAAEEIAVKRAVGYRVENQLSVGN